MKNTKFWKQIGYKLVCTIFHEAIEQRKHFRHNRCSSETKNEKNIITTGCEKLKFVNFHQFFYEQLKNLTSIDGPVSICFDQKPSQTLIGCQRSSLKPFSVQKSGKSPTRKAKTFHFHRKQSLKSPRTKKLTLRQKSVLFASPEAFCSFCRLRFQAENLLFKQPYFFILNYGSFPSSN